MYGCKVCFSIEKKKKRDHRKNVQGPNWRVCLWRGAAPRVPPARTPRPPIHPHSIRIPTINRRRINLKPIYDLRGYIHTFLISGFVRSIFVCGRAAVVLHPEPEHQSTRVFFYDFTFLHKMRQNIVCFKGSEGIALPRGSR